MKKSFKIFSIVFIFIFAVVTCLPAGYAREQTLNELSAQAKANRAAYNKAKNEKALTEEEREKTIYEKEQVQGEIKTINTNLDNIKKEVGKLQKSIETKDKEIKELMEFVQVSNGENTYLEYAFGASTFTDFIYRVAVAEQLSNYNEELIDGYNEDIKKHEKKQKELNAKQTELEKKQQELALLEVKLDKEIEQIGEGMSSKDDEYKTQMGLINSLKSLGCKGNETMSSCKRRIAASIPSSTPSVNGVASANGTYMPLARGYVTSDYGQRSFDYHTGIDFSNRSVSNVYPVANGRVVHITYGSTSTCGNHIVYVYHNIGGGYTTSYWHLTSARVSVGQNVTPNTVLGQTGGPGYTDGYWSHGRYIQCAFGGHLHLNLFYGLSTNNSGRINPRKLMPQIPREGSYFVR